MSALHRPADRAAALHGPYRRRWSGPAMCVAFLAFVVLMVFGLPALAHFIAGG